MQKEEALNGYRSKTVSGITRMLKHQIMQYGNAGTATENSHRKALGFRERVATKVVVPKLSEPHAITVSSPSGVLSLTLVFSSA